MEATALEPFTGIGTVFMSDVTGLAQATDGLEPEEVAAILQCHIECVERVIERHGGTVLQFAGAAALAF